MDDLEIGQKIKTLLLDLAEVFYRHGFTEVRVKDVLRLMGVDDTPTELDEDVLVLDSNFPAILAEYRARNPQVESVGNTLH